MASNPFGEDDDDIDIKKLLQCHIEVFQRHVYGMYVVECIVMQSYFTRQDAERLQQLYTSSPTDELVQKSMESPANKLPVQCSTITSAVRFPC